MTENGKQYRNALPEGSMLEEFRLIKVLGAGGFGITYLAEDTTLEQEVAIKEYLPNDIAVREGSTVHPKTSDEQGDYAWGLERFEQEAKTLARFRHPNLVQVRRFFRGNNTAYMVMEYEDGRSLDKLIEGNRTLEEADIVKILLPLLDGLEVVHAAGVLHRDIKPANIYIRRKDESPVLLDFGAARQAIGRRSKSVTSVVSPGYSPLEQYQTDGEAGAWSDIYSLGAVCYRLITGKTPVEATRRSIAHVEEREDPLPRLSGNTQGYRREFLKAIDQSLLMRTLERPQSISSWRQELGLATSIKRQEPQSIPPQPDVVTCPTRVPEIQVEVASEQDRSPQPNPVPKKKQQFLRKVAGVTLLVVVVIGYMVWNQQRVEGVRREQAFNALLDQAEVAARGGDHASAEVSLKQAEAMGLHPEKVAKAKENAFGLTLLSKAEKTVTQGDDFNTAMLYARHALDRLDPGKTTEVERARTLLANSPISPMVYRTPTNALLPGEVSSVAYSPDGKILASATSGHSYQVKTIILWDTTTGKGRAMDYSRGVSSLSFSPDGLTLAAGTHDNSVILWDTATGTKKALLEGHSSQVSSVAFSPDGRTLASGSMDQNVVLWDTATGTAKVTLNGHAGMVHSVDFSPDSRILASASSFICVTLPDSTGSSCGALTLWDTATGTAKTTINGLDVYGHVAYSPDGRTVAYGSYDGTVTLWDTMTGAAKTTMKGHSNWVSSVAFSPDGKTLASVALSDNTVTLWDTTTGMAKTPLKGPGLFRSVTFSPNGRTLAAGSFNGSLTLWNIPNGEVRTITNTNGHLNEVMDVAFSPDGRMLASGSYDQSVILWNTVTGEAKTTLNSHSDLVNSVAYSPDGRTLAAGLHHGSIILWNTATDTTRITFKGHSDMVLDVAFSSDGLTLASGSSDKTIMLWDTKTGTAKTTLKGHSDKVNSVAFSPDGRTLASGSSDKTIMLWDTKTGAAKTTLKSLTDDDYVYSVAFSPDGRTLAAGSFNGSLTLWNTTTGVVKNTLNDNQNWILTVAFSPDGRTLASGANDGSIILWNVATNAVMTILKGHSRAVNRVAFSSDGRTLASGSEDNTMIFWDIGGEERYHQLSSIQMELAFGMHLEGMELVSDSSPPTLYGPSKPTPPYWLEDHPFHWLPAAEKGDGKAMLQLGTIYERDGNREKAAEWFRKAKEAGEPEAKVRMENLRQ